MKMSRLFAPTMKDSPKGVFDPILKRLVRGGYVAALGLPEKLFLFPLGIRLWNKTSCRVEETLLSSGFQALRIDEMERNLVNLASGFVKSYRHMPLRFYQKDRHGFNMSGLEEDVKSASGSISALLENLRSALSTSGKEALSGQTVSAEGLNKFVALPAQRSLPWAHGGYRCVACHWCGDENSPIHGPVDVYKGLPGIVEVVDTPGADTIAELCRQLGVGADKTLKTMFYAAEGKKGKEIVVVLVRGDHRISDAKVMKVLGASSLRFADSLEIRETVGDLAGYLGPVGLPKKLKIIADRHVEGVINVVTGANEPGKHLVNVCWGRDFVATLVEDLVCFEKDGSCPLCGASIEETALSRVVTAVVPEESLPEETEVSFQAADGSKKRPTLWSGRVNMDAACVALVPQEGPLPLSFAPFKVSVVVASMKNGDAVAAAEKIADELEKSGADVLHDERDERAGVKFSDAELIGFPAVVVCGRDASEGKVELRLPGKGNELVAIDDVCSRLIEFLSA